MVKVAHTLLIPNALRLASLARGVHLVLLLIGRDRKRLCHVGGLRRDCSETAIFNASAVGIPMSKLAFARVTTLLATSGSRSLNLLGMATVRV